MCVPHISFQYFIFCIQMFSSFIQMWHGRYTSHFFYIIWPWPVFIVLSFLRLPLKHYVIFSVLFASFQRTIYSTICLRICIILSIPLQKYVHQSYNVCSYERTTRKIELVFCLIFCCLFGAQQHTATHFQRRRKKKRHLIPWYTKTNFAYTYLCNNKKIVYSSIYSMCMYILYHHVKFEIK